MVENQSKRPEGVQTAVTLLYFTLVIGLIRGFLESSRLTQGASLGIVIFMLFTFGILCLMWFLIHRIEIGENWARITFLVLLVGGLPFSIQPLRQSFVNNYFNGLLGVVQSIFQIIAVAFLFQKSSSDWFKQMANWR